MTLSKCHPDGERVVLEMLQRHGLLSGGVGKSFVTKKYGQFVRKDPEMSRL